MRAAYRPGVGILLFDPRGLAFVGQRNDTPGAWQMPQGGIDPGESPEDAAARELRTNQPTVGRRIAALEEVLGVRLFHRHARGMSLTEAGAALEAELSGTQMALLEEVFTAAGPDAEQAWRALMGQLGGGR